jgi:hypothetical protein
MSCSPAVFLFLEGKKLIYLLVVAEGGIHERLKRTEMA